MTRHFLMTLAMIASLFFVAGCAYVAGRVDGMADALELFRSEGPNLPGGSEPPVLDAAGKQLRREKQPA
ncbi:hypothetical protein [Afifella aestuarii]|uniref:hypothetical protein n=1 Tax=Afifella aestuarii TaxID=1909496 RepID=UPI000FE394A1|nr:hypothetical protein [Afifella aestuarii]